MDPMPLDPIERQSASGRVQINVASEDWARFQAWERQRNVPEATSAPKVIDKHSRFFHPAENIFFLVKNTLYSVSRAPFEKCSLSFIGQGLAEDDPLIVEDIKVAHFDHFLSILYPSEYGVYTATTVDEWTVILHLAVRWGFDSIKTLAIKHLAPIATDVDKIVLGRQYGIDPWLCEAFIAVCMREQSLTKEEGRRMKVDDVVEISAVRQRFGPGAQPKQATFFSIEEACVGLDLSQFVSPPTSSERAAPGVVLSGESNVTPQRTPSPSSAVSDNGDVDERDIGIVMSQVGCSRARAVQVLEESEGDLINAIMAATE